MQETNSTKYTLGKIDLDKPKNSHDFQIIFTGTDKKVLEIGTATGYISKILKQRDCHVTGLEINEEWAEEAKHHVDKMIIGDVDKLDFQKEFADEKFDVILLGDTLEHLQDPICLLKKLHFLLNHNGYLVCSIPNIAYAPIRLRLLNGEFLYEETGILDKTHTHFYTLDNILLMLDQTNFRITTLQRIKEKFHLYHRTDIKYWSFSDDVISSVLKDPESETFQFVFKASPKNSSQPIREFLIKNFPKNYVTEDLKHRIDSYLQKISYLENAIKEKDDVISHHENAINAYKSQIKEIKNSKFWKLFHLFNKTS